MTLFKREKQNIEHLPNQSIIDSILAKAHEVCSFGSTNKINPKKILSHHSLSLFAFEASKQVKSRITDGLSLNPGVGRSYLPYSDRNVEPKDPSTRRDYLMGLAALTYVLSFRYAFGNCSHLSDIVFLEACKRDLACGIHYINFFNQDDLTIENTCTVVLGDWPKPGCLIISAWESEKGRTYTWNGSYENTPQIGLNKHNTHTTLFSISSTDPFKEKSFLKHFLIQHHYDNWLNQPRRSEIKDRIRAAFSKQVSKAAFFKNSAFGFFDLVNMGSTSKGSYKHYTEILKKLEADEAVQAIAKMPGY